MNFTLDERMHLLT